MKINFKKISISILLLCTLSVRAETTGEIQKTYELPGLTADQIEKSFGPLVVDVGQDLMSKTQDSMRTTMGTGWMNSLQGGQKTKVRCNISVSSWMPAVNEWVDGDVVLQTKDNRARITVTIDKVYGPGKDTCISSIEKYLDAKFSKMKKLGGDW